MKLFVFEKLDAVDIARIETSVILKSQRFMIRDPEIFQLMDGEEEDLTVPMCLNFIRDYHREGFMGKITLVM